MRCLQWMLLVLSLALAGGPLRAQQTLGYQLHLQLFTDGIGRQYDTGLDRSVSYLILQEGARAQLTGHIWQPGFLTFELGAQAAAQHDWAGADINNYSLLGGGLRLTLLPWSITPISVFVQRNVQGLALNPGSVVQYDELGAMWRLVVPRVPRFTLQLAQNSTDLLQEGRVSPALTGPRTQMVSELYRRGRARLWYNVDEANFSATYLIEQREDRFTGSFGQRGERSYLQQQFDLDTTLRFSEKLDMVAQAGGVLYSDGQGYANLASQNYNLDYYTRYTPSPQLSSVLRYSFRDASRGVRSNSLSASARWLPGGRFDLNSGLRVEHTGWAPPLQGYRAAESAYVSGRFSNHLGPVDTSIQEQIDLGMAQLDPGRGGFLFGHQIQSGLSWRASRLHFAELATGVHNRRDLSSQGAENDSLYLSGRLLSQWMPNLHSELRTRVLQSWRSVERQQGPGLVTRSIDTDLNLRWAPIAGLSLSSLLGYSTSSSSYSPEATQVAFVSMDAIGQPASTLSLRAHGQWIVSLYHAGWRNNIQLLAGVSWLWRRLILQGDYTLNSQDTLGRPIFSQELRLSIRRDFDFGF